MTLEVMTAVSVPLMPSFFGAAGIVGLTDGWETVGVWVGKVVVGEREGDLEGAQKMNY